MCCICDSNEIQRYSNIIFYININIYLFNLIIFLYLGELQHTLGQLTRKYCYVIKYKIKHVASESIETVLTAFGHLLNTI